MYKYIIDELSRSVGKGKVLASSKDTLVYKISDKVLRVSLSKNSEEVSNEVKYMRYLAQSGLPVPEVYELTSIATDSSILPVTVMQYIENTPSKVSPKRCVAAATSLAQLHTVGYEYIKNNRYEQSRRLDDNITVLDEAINMFGEQDKKSLKQDLEWAKEFLHEATTTAMPRNTIIHNDYRPQNVLFDKNDNILAIIDFDYSIASPYPEKDVAHSAVEWSFPDGSNVPNTSILNTFIDTYARTIKQDCARYKTNHDINSWIKLSTLIDAAGYLMSSAQITRINDSYMYQKYHYFKEHPIT